MIFESVVMVVMGMHAMDERAVDIVVVVVVVVVAESNDYS
jgi:hypothetical protein